MTRAPIIFIRHGETDWNRGLRVQGQVDVPINARGRRQAARNGRAISGMLTRGEWRLVASPLCRAVETMEIALDAAGRGGEAFATDPLLMEASYGVWEGLTLSEIDARHPEMVHAREADRWAHPPGGGESLAMLAERVAPWLATVDAPTVVVSHGGNLRALHYLLAGLSGEEVALLPVRQDRVTLFAPERVLTI